MTVNNKEAFRVGDTVRVHAKVSEGGNERVQVFEGVVLKIRGTGISKTFTVRKISFGIGVEKTFPLESPRIEKLEVMRSGKVRRAKLYYLRGLRGKKARLSEREKAESEAPQSATNAPTANEPKAEAAPAASLAN